MMQKFEKNQRLIKFERKKPIKSITYEFLGKKVNKINDLAIFGYFWAFLEKPGQEGVKKAGA